MLTLNDGRAELWQWDTGRTLAVDADCSQVHFSNKVFGRSIDVDVADGTAIIPDVLLKTDNDLNVWAFVGTAENGYTKISKTFKVNRRNKPADYVFTPPDQTSIEEIKERLEYLEQNPVVPDLSNYATKDEIPDVSGFATKEEIPVVPKTLPNPNALTFTGAVNATYDGSTAVSVEIPSGGSGGTDISLGLTSAAVGQIIKVKAIDESGKPTAWEAADMPSGGGTSEEFILLAEVTLEEDVKKVTLPLSSPTKHFIARMWCPKTSSASDPTYLNIGINGSSSNLLYYLTGNLPSKNNKSQCTVEAHGLNDGNWAISAYTNLGDAEGAVSNYNQNARIPIGVKNNGIMQAESVVFDVVTNDATQYFPVGSIIRVWGV